MQAADEASSMASSQVHSPSARSAHAMHGIMDQGMTSLCLFFLKLLTFSVSLAGRVELTVSPSDTSLTVHRLAPDPSGQSGGSYNSGSDPASSHGHPDRIQRPTHVDLPQGPIFNADGQPAYSAGMPTFSSSASSSPSSYRITSSPVRQRHNPMGSTSSVASVKSPRQLFDPVLQVLVVDDDNLTRVLMQRLLTRLGCNVTAAENGELALSIIMSASTPFDVVFLDNQMPVSK